MHQNPIKIWGEYIEKEATYTSFPSHYEEVYDMNELQKLTTLTMLDNISFCASSFNDLGIKNIAKYPSNSTNLNLQETQISDNGIKYLSRLTKTRNNA